VYCGPSRCGAPQQTGECSISTRRPRNRRKRDSGLQNAASQISPRSVCDWRVLCRIDPGRQEWAGHLRYSPGRRSRFNWHTIYETGFPAQVLSPISSMENGDFRFARLEGGELCPRQPSASTCLSMSKGLHSSSGFGQALRAIQVGARQRATLTSPIVSGSPSSLRAGAQACGANRLALAIPATAL